MRGVTIVSALAAVLGVGASNDLSGRIVFVSERAPDLGRTRFVAVAPNRELGIAPPRAVLAGDGLTFAAGEGRTLVVGRLGSEPRQVATAEHPIADIAWSPDRRRLAFTIADPTFCGSGDRLCVVYRLFVVAASGGPAVELAQRARFPVWSPNGRWIAYAGEWNTFDASFTGASGTPHIVRPDGSGVRRLVRVRGLRSLAWSPRSDRVAFATGNDVVLVKPLSGRARRVGSGTIVAWAPSARLAFANAHALARSPRGALARANFAPGSFPAPTVVTVTSRRRTRTVFTTEPLQQVTFLGWRGGRFVVGTTREGTSDTDIYTMRPDGTDVRAVTASGDYEFAPTSAPDGSLIAFAGLSRTGFVQSALHVIGSDGRGRRQLTTPPPGTDDVDPAWSPEGGVIVFVRSHAAEGLRQSDLFMVRPDGQEARQLTTLPGDVRGPSWSPDGSQIAFGRLVGFHAVLAVVNADGTGYRELTNAWGSPQPAWSPDGARIAFVNPRSAGLIVYELATGSAVELHVEADPRSAPAWSPDGSHVVYLATDGELHLIDVATGTDARLTAELGLDRDPDWSHAAT